MGLKKIWDGKDLPPEGCEVLAHLSSLKAWVPHVVTGYKVSEGSSPYNHRVEIQLDKSGDPRSAKNARLLGDIRPLDDIEAVASLQQERIEDLKATLEKKREVITNIEDVVSKDRSTVADTIFSILEES